MQKPVQSAVDWLQRQIDARLPFQDILEIEPSMDIDGAYRVQFALMKRRHDAGDATIGFKAAYTSAVMRASFGIPEPVVGHLSRSGYFQDGEVVATEPSRTIVEAEVAVVLKEDLPGPNVTRLDVIRAAAGYVAGIEIALMPEQKRSRQMGIAMHKTGGGIVLGSRMVGPAEADLRLEGAVISVNGKPRGSGTGVEVLGDPLNAAALIANKVAQYGGQLRRGMILLTGSIMESVRVSPGDDVLAEFTTLGKVGFRCG
jgi:2-keto-4-pentenoate hydratase